MAWRKWFVRMLVFFIVGACAGAAFLYQRFTNPTAVREQVLAKLKTHFPGALITVDSARLRILGGINVNELRLARKDDPDKNEILHVPSAVFYHDKEKILDGKLALRMVELFHPHLRAQKNKNGTWNLQGIAAEFQTNLPLPTVFIYQGTLVLEDKPDGGTGTTVELTNVDLQLVNDPVSLVAIEGSANSEVAGKLHVTGQWQRQTQEVTLTLKAEQISLAGILASRLEKLCPAGTLEGLKLEGKADLKAELAYCSRSAQPLSYELWLNISGAKIAHPKLPLPLDHVEASVRCANGEIRLERLTAKSGLTELEAGGSAHFPCIEQQFEAHLEVRHLVMSENLFSLLPEKGQKIYPLFRPTGLATFRADVASRDGSWTALAAGEPSLIQLLPESLGITFAKFPYPLENMTGAVDMNLLTKLVQVEVTGFTQPPLPIGPNRAAGFQPAIVLAGWKPAAQRGPRPVLIKGCWQGEGEQAACHFDIKAEGITLEDRIVNALPPNLQKLARSFNATGKGDIKAHIQHEPGAKEYHNEYHVRFYETALCWDPFPYPLEGVTGYLDIYPKYWEFKNGRGTHHGGEVLLQAGYWNRTPLPAVDGVAREGASNHWMVLDIVGRSVPVDEDLHQALAHMQHLGRSWETFRPHGQLHFTARINSALVPDDADVHLDLKGVAIEPTFFPYALDNMSGKFHYHNNRLEIRDVTANHQDTQLALDKGSVMLHKGGGHYTVLNQLKVNGLVMNEDFLEALPRDLRQQAATLGLHEPLLLATGLVVSQSAEAGNRPDIYWDGQCWLKNAKLATGLEWSKVTGTIASRGLYRDPKHMAVEGNVLLDEATVLGQPFRNMHVAFHVKETAPDVLLLDVKAPLFGGDISGDARIDMNSTLRYELNLTGSQLDLAQFGQHNLGPSSQLQGLAMARLHLTGQGSGSDTLDGNGAIDVPNGRLYNLPLLLDILKFLGLRWPDRTAFEELHAAYSIHGKRVRMTRLDILGSAISLSGEGEFNLDGTDVALDFHPGWPRIDQLLPPAFRPLPPAVSKNLLTIEMRGKVTANENDRKFTLKPIPGIIDLPLQVRKLFPGAPQQEHREENRLLPELGAAK